MYAGFLFRCEKSAADLMKQEKLKKKRRRNCLGKIIDLLHCLIFLIFERGHRALNLKSKKKKHNTFSAYCLSTLCTEILMFVYLCVCCILCSFCYYPWLFFKKKNLLGQYGSLFSNPVQGRAEKREERRLMWSERIRVVTRDVNRWSALYRGDSQRQHGGKTAVRSWTEGRGVWTVMARAGETGL